MSDELDRTEIMRQAKVATKSHAETLGWFTSENTDSWNSSLFPADAVFVEDVAEVRIQPAVVGTKLEELTRKIKEMESREVIRKLIAAMQDVNRHERLETVTSHHPYRSILKNLRSDRVSFSHYIRSSLKSDGTAGDIVENEEEMVDDNLVKYKYLFLSDVIESLSEEQLRHLTMRIKCTDEFKKHFVGLLKEKAGDFDPNLLAKDAKEDVAYWWYETVNN